MQNLPILTRLPLIFLSLMLLFSRPVFANSQAVINQQQRQNALDNQLMPVGRSVSLSSFKGDKNRISFPEERACFSVNQVILEGSSALPGWIPLRKITRQAEGRCLGGKGINLLMKKLQNKLVEAGYITSRIVAPEQDLNLGQLKLKLILGRIGEIKFAKESSHYLNLFTAWPAHHNDLLNLRDLEQGLENQLRLPTVESEMKIIPGTHQGISDIEINWRQTKKWRLDLSVDDGGLISTGRYQGSLTLFLDNPFALSDLLYFSTSREVEQGNKKKNRYRAAHYSLPLGYWLMGMTGSQYRYQQNIAGLFTDYRYRGEMDTLDIWLRRTLHHDALQKTTLTANVLARRSRNFLEETELEIQRRQTSTWRLGLQHEHRIGSTSLLLGASYQRGTRWFGARPAPEERSGQATALGKTVQLNARLNQPFQLSGQQFRYNASYFRQLSPTPLTPQDQLAIGNRWTVRGFDGQRTLSAIKGWYVRNDLAWRTPVPLQELYLGFDYGEVSGYSPALLAGNRLSGSVIGLRGNTLNIGYDLFAGIPLSRPEGFITSKVTYGFNANWSF